MTGEANELQHVTRGFASLLVVLATVAVAGCSQASATTATNPEEAGAVAAVASGDATAGQAVFAKTCDRCHSNANAGMGPALYGAQFSSRYPDDAGVAGVIRRGKGGMPAFSTAQLSDQDMEDVIAYLRGLSSGAVSAEATPTPRPRRRGD
jgi:mono/diheme cytochrome c family protein